MVAPHDLSNNPSNITVEKINLTMMENFVNDDVGPLFDGKATETNFERNAKTLNKNTSIDVPYDVDKIVK